MPHGESGAVGENATGRTGVSTGELIYDLPFEEYVRLPGEHATALKDILVSPRLYWRRRQIPHGDRDALRVGRAGHTSILEPDRFALDFAVWRKKDGRRGTNAHKAWVAAHSDKTHLTEEQYYTSLRARDAVREHPVARELLSGGRSEVTVKWTHSYSGLACLSRYDYLRDDCFIDIKLTRNPSPAKFASDAARFGYPLQMGMYLDAGLAATGKLLPCKIIAVQNVEPFDVVVFNVPDEVLLHGRVQYEQALEKLIECRGSNKWPGIAPDGEAQLMLPHWAMPEDEAGPDESQPIEEDVAF